MTAGPRSAGGGGPSRALGLLLWVTWLAVLAVVALAFWADAKAWSWSPRDGAVLFLAALALAAALPFVPLRTWRTWELIRAARRLAPGPADGRAALAGWPGLRERGGELIVGCVRRMVLFWSVPLGLTASLYLYDWLGPPEFRRAELFLCLAPAAILPLLAVSWGPAGWRLTVDGARQSAVLIRFKPLRRVEESAASLPTVQAVTLAAGARGAPVLIVHQTRGSDWELALPRDWPPELARALAARLAHLAGVEAELPDGKGE